MAETIARRVSAKMLGEELATLSTDLQKQARFQIAILEKV